MLQLRSISLLLVLGLSVFAIGCSPTTDEKLSETASDSTFKVLQDSTWHQIKRYQKNGSVEKADSLQRVRARVFFQYYRDHPQTQLGRMAAHDAFLMWNNIDAVQEVQGALPHIDRDSKLWGRILIAVRYTYGPSKATDFVELLHRLKGELTHPWGKSAVRMQLANHYRREGKQQKAIGLYREILKIDAHPNFIERATGHLHEMESLNVGQTAPTFEAATVRGDTVNLSKLRGNVVLLEFWATWCGPCKPEIPYLKSVWSEYRNEDFRLIGIAQDKSTETLRQVLDERNMTWPQIQEEKQQKGEVSDLYNANGIPRAYLIDRQGTIAAKDLRKEEIEKEVRRLMEKF
jgi:peroxiredoxin